MQNILDVEMPPNDADAKNIREYLLKLLSAVWHERERFNGKRPFGNSSWQYEIYAALVTHGFVEGKLDGDSSVEDIDYKKADTLIAEAINSLM